MIKEIQEIDVKEFSAQEFENHFYKKSIPLIVRGLEIDNEEGKWTTEYFKSIPEFYEKEVHVRVYETEDLPNFFNSNEKVQEDGFIDVGTDMRLIDALELIMSDPKKNGKYHNILEGEIRELIDNIELPEFVQKWTNKMMGNIWMGNGNLTGIHFDGLNNFYFQKKGNKKFVIFSPHNYSYLYHKGPNTGGFLYLQDADMKRFPLYKYAVPIEVTLNEGDFLYLPPFWWHQVEAYNSYISINYWASPVLEQYLCQPGYYFIMKHFELGNLIDIASALFEDKSNWAYSLTKMSYRLTYIGHSWVAVLILLSALERKLVEICKDHGYELGDSYSEKIKELSDRMDNSELNYNNILQENIASERLFELINTISDNTLLDKELVDDMYDWFHYIHIAKKKDSIMLTIDKIQKLIGGLNAVCSIEKTVA